MNLSSPGSKAPVDHWHNDSIAFAGVVVLSDMEVVIIGIQAGSDLAKFRFKTKFLSTSTRGWKEGNLNYTGGSRRMGERF